MVMEVTLQLEHQATQLPVQSNMAYKDGCQTGAPFHVSDDN